MNKLDVQIKWVSVSSVGMVMTQHVGPKLDKNLLIFQA